MGPAQPPSGAGHDHDASLADAAHGRSLAGSDDPSETPTDRSAHALRRDDVRHRPDHGCRGAGSRGGGTRPPFALAARAHTPPPPPPAPSPGRAAPPAPGLPPDPPP